MDDDVEFILSIDRFAEPFRLESVLTPKAHRHYQGGGIDTPALNRTLNLGGHLVIRELLRHRVIRSPFAILMPMCRLIESGDFLINSISLSIVHQRFIHCCAHLA